MYSLIHLGPLIKKDNLIPSSQTTNYSQSIQLKATRVSSHIKLKSLELNQTL
ncbi:hypothetical protein Fmac_005404 [Flemingia macrophylla]|uniref:Uncharacterized protein n=1 Tax=Flemingia macrophylla TaxID=520843 RepID=A0ABD1N7R0_9FABA